jgi:hypothetical protein
MIQKRHNPYPSLAEMIRKQGRNGDTVLAHINPIEAQILKDLGGSGKINPKTGIPEFGGVWDFITTPFREIGKGIGELTGTEGGMFGSKGTYWRKPTGLKADVSNALSYGPAAAVGMNLLPKKTKKAATSFGQKYVIPVGAAMIGNTFLPGIGGAIGGSLGGTAGAGLRGSSLSEGAMRGGTIGALLPSAASLGGSAASSLGFNGLGSALSNYGTQNAILPSLGRLLGVENMGSGFSSNTGGAGSILSNLFGTSNQRTVIPNSSGYSGLGVGAGSDAATDEDLGFMDKLLNKSSNFFSEPSNLLTTAVLASSFMNRPKKETPEKLARDEKAYQKALMLTSEELQQKEAQDLALAQMKRRIERNKFLPEERFAIEPLYVKSNTPEEYKRKGQWLNYYNNPDFSGEPLVMRKGGSVNLPTQRTNLKNKFAPKERFFNETLDFLPKERFSIKPLVKKRGGQAKTNVFLK